MKFVEFEHNGVTYAINLDHVLRIERMKDGKASRITMSDGKEIHINKKAQTILESAGIELLTVIND